MGLGIVRVLGLCGLCLVAVLPARAASVFYGVDGGYIGRVGSDGSNPTTIVSGLDTPRYITADPASGRIYWSNPAGGSIGSARFDGSAGQTIFQTGSTYGAGGIGLEPATGTLYVSVYGFGDPSTIDTVGINGSNYTSLITGLPGAGQGLTLDPAHDRLYWVDGSAIWYSNLAGTLTPSKLFDLASIAPQGFLQGLAYDSATGLLYFTGPTAPGQGLLGRVATDGSGYTPISTEFYNANIAIDSAAGQLYVAQGYAGTITRIGMDGSNPTVILSGLPNVYGIAVVDVPAPPGLALFLTAVAALALLRRRPAAAG